MKIRKWLHLQGSCSQFTVLRTCIRYTITLGVLLFYVVCMTACVTDSSQGRMTGADRDEHGCIGSAGYLWCAKTQQCERPWEIAKKYGFPKTSESFTAFCED